MSGNDLNSFPTIGPNLHARFVKVGMKAKIRVDTRVILRELSKKGFTQDTESNLAKYAFTGLHGDGMALVTFDQVHAVACKVEVSRLGRLVVGYRLHGFKGPSIPWALLNDLFLPLPQVVPTRRLKKIFKKEKARKK